MIGFERCFRSLVQGGLHGDPQAAQAAIHEILNAFAVDEHPAKLALLGRLEQRVVAELGPDDARLGPILAAIDAVHAVLELRQQSIAELSEPNPEQVADKQEQKGAIGGDRRASHEFVHRRIRPLRLFPI
jgi:hypothetical protein